MEILGWKEVLVCLRVVWRCVMMEYGGPYAMRCGAKQMQL